MVSNDQESEAGRLKQYEDEKPKQALTPDAIIAIDWYTVFLTRYTDPIEFVWENYRISCADLPNHSDKGEEKGEKILVR